MSWVLLGASKGLGRSFLEKALASQVTVHALSRKIDSYPLDVQAFSFDFSQASQWPDLIERIRELNPERIFYFAGGGPFGNFQTKEWKDHQWAWKVSFECPAFLLHQFLRDPRQLKQFVAVGSSVAEG